MNYNIGIKSALIVITTNASGKQMQVQMDGM